MELKFESTKRGILKLPISDIEHVPIVYDQIFVIDIYDRYFSFFIKDESLYNRRKKKYRVPINSILNIELLQRGKVHLVRNVNDRLFIEYVS